MSLLEKLSLTDDVSIFKSGKVKENTFKYLAATSLKELEAAVNEAISVGWFPVSSVSVQGRTFIQSIFLRDSIS